ncbi:MAG: hypothetical protein ABR575_09830 [Actinomycetota bacterium]
MGLRVAVVTSDPSIRDRVARAFDHAPGSWSVTLHDAPPGEEAADVVVCGPDAPRPAGALTFEPGGEEDLVGAIEAWRRCREPASKRIAVTSPVGGAGATTVALHLAGVFSAAADTCVVDLDPRGGVLRRLGIEPYAHLAAGDLTNDLSARRAAIPVAPGFRVLPGAEQDAAVVWASRAFERVIVDIPAPRAAAAVLAATDAGVLVMPPTVPAARRAAELLAGAPSPPWAVVLNRAGPGGETTTAAIEDLLGRGVALELPCAPALRDAEDRGALLDAPWSRWLRRVRRLAAALS